MPIDTETGVVFRWEDEDEYMAKKKAGLFKIPAKGNIIHNGKEIKLSTMQQVV